MTRRLLRTEARDRGAVIPIVALLLPVLMVMTAFAVDLGRQRADRRNMQAVADVIALDMSRLADGRPLSQIQTGSGNQPPAETALLASAARNGVARSQLTLDWGVWDDNVGYQSLNGNGALVPNAAKIMATDTTDYYFQPGTGSTTREAIASNGADPYAGFSVGAFGLAMSTSQAQLLDDLISPYVDDPPTATDPVQLDAASYQGLAGADIPLGDFAPWFNAGTPRELLDTEVPLSEFMLISATILRNKGRAVEADLVEGSISGKMDGIGVRLADFVNAEPGAEDSAMGADVDLPGVIAGSVFQAQCAPNATGFEQCDALAIPNLTATIPLTTATGSVKVIESERYHYGPVGSGVDTGQIQATVRTVTSAQHVGNCQPRLSNLYCVLSSGLLVEIADAVVTVDATVTLAGGHTSIADIDCADPDALGLLLESRTSLYDVDLDVRVDYGTRGLLGLLGTVFGTVRLTGGTERFNSIDDVRFTVAPDVLGETVRTTGENDVGLAPITLSTVGSTTAFNDLSYLRIDHTFTNMLNLLVNPLLAEIDQEVLSPLADLLGMNVAGSDLVAHAIDCNPGHVRLVV